MTWGLCFAIAIASAMFGYWAGVHEREDMECEEEIAKNWCIKEARNLLAFKASLSEKEKALLVRLRDLI